MQAERERERERERESYLSMSLREPGIRILLASHHHKADLPQYFLLFAPLASSHGEDPPLCFLLLAPSASSHEEVFFLLY
jgi:hypothetical protein